MVVSHLKLSPGDIHPVVLVVGDPFRVPLVAKFADSSKEMAFNREYRTFNCIKDGVNFTVCSHGIGGPGAAICFEELIQLGAKVLIRLGTCGSLQPKTIVQGDIILSTSCVALDGHHDYYVPPHYPAAADVDLVVLLRSLLEKSKGLHEGHNCFSGITLSHGLFYPSPSSDSALQTYSRLNVLAVEMETSTVFTVASVRGIAAAGIAAVDGSPLEWDKGNYDPASKKMDNAKEWMFQVGVQAAVILGPKYAKK